MNVGMPERALKKIEQSQAGAWKSTVKKYYVFAVLVLIVLIFSVAKLGSVEFFGRGHFLSADNIINILRMAVPIMTLSGGFTLLMISGNIDLSVGSALSLSAVVYSLMIINGFGFALSLILTLVLGIVMGFANGFLVMRLRITPVIATLVTLNLFKGIALLIVPDGLSGIKDNASQHMPTWINDYARKDVLLGLPAAFFVAVAVIIILVIVQRKTVLGKYAAAIGGNRTAAELSGINAVKMGWILYIIVGFLAALAGVAGASYNSMGNPLSGDGMELDCIIAVLLGGTSFAGGEGSVIKTIIGALIIMCVTTGLMTVVDPYYQIFAKGLVLVLAVALNHLLVRQKVSA
jgi:ribose/xylose/arabinose/galactoside ABC-type transport system permease subunit